MGGNIDPYINIVFSPIQGDEPQIVSLVIFAWTDIADVGIPEQNGVVPRLLMLLAYNRESIFAIRHPFNADGVQKNISVNS